jgi:hypothetical protein
MIDSTWMLSIVDKGGVLALAAVSLWMLDRVWRDRLSEEKRNSQSLRDLTCQLRDVISENTKAITLFLERSHTRRTDDDERK